MRGFYTDWPPSPDSCLQRKAYLNHLLPIPMAAGQWHFGIAKTNMQLKRGYVATFSSFNLGVKYKYVAKVTSLGGKNFIPY
jgi:hypothetical protein